MPWQRKKKKERKKSLGYKYTCDDLNEKCLLHARLFDVFVLSGTVWRSLGDVALLEEVCPCSRVWVFVWHPHHSLIPAYIWRCSFQLSTLAPLPASCCHDFCHDELLSLWNHKPKQTLFLISCVGYGVWPQHSKVTNTRCYLHEKDE